MNDNQSTAIVYVTSPDSFQYSLFNSIRSLIYSGTSFDKIIIKCIGKKPINWRFTDTRIAVEEVPPHPNARFVVNKVRSVECSYDRIIFIDSDTFICKSIDPVYTNNEADFIARPVQIYDDKLTIPWATFCRTLGVGAVKCYNSGFFILQNGTAEEVSKNWLSMISRVDKTGFAEKYHGRPAVSEQMGLSLAVSAAGLTTADMSAAQHRYVWQDAEWRKKLNESIVLHYSGGPRIRYQLETEVKTGLSLKPYPCKHPLLSRMLLRRVVDTAYGAASVLFAK